MQFQQPLNEQQHCAKWVTYDICDFFHSKYIKKTIVLLMVKNTVLYYEDLKNDMLMKMLQLLRLHSTHLNQVGEVPVNQPCFQVGRNMGL